MFECVLNFFPKTKQLEMENHKIGQVGHAKCLRVGEVTLWDTTRTLGPIDPTIRWE